MFVWGVETGNYTGIVFIGWVEAEKEDVVVFMWSVEFKNENGMVFL